MNKDLPSPLVKEQIAATQDEGPKPKEELTGKEIPPEFLLVSGSGGRTILHVPRILVNRVGGRDVIWKKIFPSIFNGSYPLWGDNTDDAYYLVEVPSKDPQKIEALKSAILTKAEK